MGPPRQRDASDESQQERYQSMSERREDQIWQMVVTSIQEHEKSQQLNVWLGRIRLAEIGDSKIVLEVANQFFRDHLDNHYYDIFYKHFKEILNLTPHLIFRVNPELKLPVEPEAELLPPPEPPQVAKSGKRATGVLLGAVNPRHTFENFVEGKSNQFAYNACRACAEKPGERYNPLFIAAGSGLGKTHLLTAIGHFIHEQDTSATISVVTAEKFTNEFIAQVRTHNMEEFRRKYREQCDVLLVDDIQFLAGKTGTLEEFFHTFNSLTAASKLVVLTSDKPPAEIGAFEERIRTRFAHGLIVDISPPELETRIAILENMAQREGVHLDSKVSTFIASCVRSNVRELEGALTRVLAYASFHGVEVSEDLARKALQSILREAEEKVTVEKIQDCVARYFGIKVADLCSQCRKRKYTEPRRMAMLLCRKHLGLSYPELGAKFGGKDHSTVIHACDKALEDLEQDEDLRNALLAIEREFIP